MESLRGCNAPLQGVLVPHFAPLLQQNLRLVTVPSSHNQSTMDSLFGENFMNRILAFSEMVSSYNPLHEFLLGDDQDKNGEIGNKLQETLDEEENVNVEVNEEEEIKDEFVDKESVKVKNEKGVGNCIGSAVDRVPTMAV